MDVGVKSAPGSMGISDSVDVGAATLLPPEFPDPPERPILENDAIFPLAQV